MNTSTRNTLIKAIVTIFGILLAALLGWIAGCSVTKRGTDWQVEAFYPSHRIQLHLQLEPATRPIPALQP